MGAVVVNGIAKARFIMRLGLAWLGFSGLGVAVGRLDRPAQIADAYVEYADMSHTHTRTLLQQLHLQRSAGYLASFS